MGVCSHSTAKVETESRGARLSGTDGLPGLAPMALKKEALQTGLNSGPEPQDEHSATSAKVPVLSTTRGPSLASRRREAHGPPDAAGLILMRETRGQDKLPSTTRIHNPLNSPS